MNYHKMLEIYLMFNKFIFKSMRIKYNNIFNYNIYG